MHVLRGFSRLSPCPACVLTIGNFDGVHLGHRALLEKVLRHAHQEGLSSAVLTFEPHPREFLRPSQAPARITNLRDKLASLAETGIDRVIVERFNGQLSRLGAEEFIEKILLENCNMRHLIIGNDFRFGHKRSGDIPLLLDYASHYHFSVETVPTVNHSDTRISSSAIRNALNQGDMRLAENLLGHRFSISGHVTHGQQLGHKLGFPTINLAIRHRLPVVSGIFIVQVLGLDNKPLPGVASIGTRPTVSEKGQYVLEVHLLNFKADVYGKLVRVEFLEKLRNETKYNNLDELKIAIADDTARAERYFEALTH